MLGMGVHVLKFMHCVQDKGPIIWVIIRAGDTIHQIF